LIWGLERVVVGFFEWIIFGGLIGLGGFGVLFIIVNIIIKLLYKNRYMRIRKIK
jgi:hypothetical protein